MVRVFDLAQDLSFAYDEGIQAAGDLQQVAHTAGSGERVKVLFVEGTAGDAFYGRVQRFHAVVRFLRYQIQLGAVAGGNQNGFGKIIGLPEEPQDMFDTAAGKIKFLAYFHRGSLMIQT